MLILKIWIICSIVNILNNFLLKKDLTYKLLEDVYDENYYIMGRITINEWEIIGTIGGLIQCVVLAPLLLIFDLLEHLTFLIED